MPALDYFRIGPYEFPEKATTMIVQVEDIVPVSAHKYSDILVDKGCRVALKGVPDKFWNQWQQLSGHHPLGIDIFFTCDDVLIALPRIKPIKH